MNMSVGIIDADVPSPNDAYTVDFDLDFNLDVNLSVNTIWNENNTFISDTIFNDHFNTNTSLSESTTTSTSTFNAEYFSDSSSATTTATPVLTSDLIWNAFEIPPTSTSEVPSDLFIYQTDNAVNISDLTLTENCGYDILKDSLFELDLFGESLKDIDGISNLETTPLETTQTNPSQIIDWNRRRSLLYDKNEFVRTNQDNTRPCRKHQDTIKIKTQSTSPKQNIIEEQRSYRCSVRDCEKTYCKASHLKSHMRRHSGFKPFACDWEGCKWRFSRSDELARHKRSHSGIKPYSCDLCDKAFSRSDHLSKHSKVHMKKLALYGTPIITKKCNYKYLSTNRIKVE